MTKVRFLGVVGPLVGVALAGSVPAVSAAPAFKILIEQDGVYRTEFEDLAAAGLGGATPSAGLAVSSAGEPVPIWISDGGDGSFGPGDHFEMVGRRLAGEVSWVHDFARHNVYQLRLDSVGGARMVADVAAGSKVVSRLPRVRRHLEQEKILARLPGRGDGPEDSWFWAKMVHNHTAPVAIPLDLSGLDVKGTVHLELEVRGWSTPKNKASPEVADHRLVVKLGERTLHAQPWNGSGPHRIVARDLPASWFAGEAPELLLRVPVRREAKEEGRALIDVVMLNWIELDYSHGSAPPVDDRRLEVEGVSALRLDLAEDEYLLFSDQGRRMVVAGHSRIVLDDGELSVRIARADRLRRPVAVVTDRDSRWRDAGQQADYLVVVHEAFRQAIEPLVAMHRRRGLAVVVAEIEDIYDEFNHGVAHPRAVRDFVAHASREWQKPAPRFLLLVGDASWDVKNSRADDELYADWTYRPGESRDFTKNTSTAYDGETGARRHFVPTWQTSTSQGHAASDNFFVDVEGEDGAPDLAVGRLPVASTAELEVIVEKILRYVEQPEAGEWQRRVLLVTNEQKTYQRRSDGLAEQLTGEGFLPRKIYPESSEVSNERHTEGLIESLGDGQLLVHFIGHGGRYIWRTGPPDIKKNHDLFTLEDLERLPPSRRLPVVISLTCYSAPFDHPTADSIGEKFLRLEDRGAIGVIAASWRNSPRVKWGSVLFEQLTRPGTTVGEALMRAKHEVSNKSFRETYNLLGDPAVPVALPPELAKAKVEAGDAAPGLGSD